MWLWLGIGWVAVSAGLSMLLGAAIARADRMERNNHQ